MKTIHSQENGLLIEWLSSKRLFAGLTQQQLSELLGKPQSFVSKYENGERRLDFVETIEICKSLKSDPHELIDLLKDIKNGY